MRRHDLDLVSVIAGVLFVLVAAAYLGAEISDRRLDGEWVFPGLLVGLGVLGLVATLWGGRAKPEPVEVADNLDTADAADVDDGEVVEETEERRD